MYCDQTTQDVPIVCIEDRSGICDRHFDRYHIRPKRVARIGDIEISVKQWQSSVDFDWHNFSPANFLPRGAQKKSQIHHMMFIVWEICLAHL